MSECTKMVAEKFQADRIQDRMGNARKTINDDESEEEERVQRRISFPVRKTQHFSPVSRTTGGICRGAFNDKNVTSLPEVAGEEDLGAT